MVECGYSGLWWRRGKSHLRSQIFSDIGLKRAKTGKQDKKDQSLCYHNVTERSGRARGPGESVPQGYKPAFRNRDSARVGERKNSRRLPGGGEETSRRKAGPEGMKHNELDSMKVESEASRFLNQDSAKAGSDATSS